MEHICVLSGPRSALHRHDSHVELASVERQELHILGRRSHRLLLVHPAGQPCNAKIEQQPHGLERVTSFLASHFFLLDLLFGLGDLYNKHDRILLGRVL